ncbi:MAG TPA: gamma-glutamyl-gamma-aminobutyrate hydrolase family protein [Anaerolineaceae bacterium]
MPKPLIGVTSNRLPQPNGTCLATVGEAYIQSVQKAGGVPVLIPAGTSKADLEILLMRLDGFLLTGGGDIDPVIFSGKPHPRVGDVEPLRDQTEIDLVRLLSRENKPFLGICRGIQVINVALGGTLYTHIADQLPGALRHDWFPDIPRDYLAHAVRVVPGSRLAHILGTESIETNSLHHQGLENLAPGLQPLAYAPDNLVEAVELTGHPFGIGVQWHPECMPDSAPMQAIFRTLVEASAR